MKPFQLICLYIFFTNRCLWQVLSTRARKNVVMSEIKVDVCIFAFDILYRNGQPLLQEQLKIRREVHLIHCRSIISQHFSSF